MIGADQVVGSRLGGRVRAVGRVRRGLRKSRVLGAERAVDLVGRNVQKAKPGFFLLSQFRPIGSGFLKQAESAVHIGAHEIVWTMDGAVYLSLCREVHNGAGTVVRQKIAD